MSYPYKIPPRITVTQHSREAVLRYAESKTRALLSALHESENPIMELVITLERGPDGVVCSHRLYQPAARRV